jgi:hypothetical protein
MLDFVLLEAAVVPVKLAKVPSQVTTIQNRVLEHSRREREQYFDDLTKTICLSNTIR